MFEIFTSVIKSKNNSLQEKYDNIYEELCDLEYDITNQEIWEQAIKQLSYKIDKMEIIPKNILIKIMQISQLLLKQNHPTLDIRRFQQHIQKYKDYKYYNLTQNTENYKISKASSFSYECLRYVAISPTEKYLLVGIKYLEYLYDIQTKFIMKIYQADDIKTGLFSQNSSQIILASFKRITIVNINKSKRQNIKIIVYYSINMQIQKNQLYLTIDYHSRNARIIKFNLKSGHQVFSQNIENIDSVQYYEDLIIFQSSDYLQIIDEKSRKYKLKIELEYSSDKYLLRNKNEMLSIDTFCKMIIWNMDYLNNCLRKVKVIPVYAEDLFRSNPSFDYIYTILDHQFKIIDGNYNLIYRGSLIKTNKYINDLTGIISQQFNSDKIFIIFQEDGISLLQKTSKNWVIY